VHSRIDGVSIEYDREAMLLGERSY
jgi:hypothetical protein